MADQRGRQSASLPVAAPNASGSQPGSAAQGQTSAGLNFMPMRLYQRRRRARYFLEGVLSASPRFATLSAAQQMRIRTECDEMLRENIVDFMENTAPRTVYPYEDAVRNAIKMTIHWNPDICKYKEEEWQSGPAGQNNGGEEEFNEDEE
ncbi:hypothetical protein PG994_008142 [Apiospora phragmitis]|uniref:Uncharacterized protein n=1 Tax=Apiospora phragmitis TaxID=2905665 RepID=A0ABR1UUL3_9PEZI